MKNYELVQKGFGILHPLMASYIGMEMYKTFNEDWWQEVLRALSDQRDVPTSGDYGELLDSLDVANCLRLIDREWNDVFRQKLPLNIRTWAKELMGVRNTVSHMGQQDLSQADAERALDTMSRICEVFDEDGAKELREIYNQIRFGGEQPASSKEKKRTTASMSDKSSNQARGVSCLQQNGTVDLLSLVGTEFVQRTSLSRKITYAGKTTAYPVYRVRLDALYYNDQNDRIATWITRYRSEHGEGTLAQLEGEEYNKVIENFVYESNPESIQKTQKNIALIGQREPGVALADGRIVDGNRRYTCLRRLQRGSAEPLYFETVIMDVDIHKDKKQIKILELAIQHGEEKKVDYDHIDYAIGTYMDVVKTRLLTIEEYADSTNETIAEVKKRIECAEFINELLVYLRIPEQYHAARELQVYSVFQEMAAPLHQLKEYEKQQLKMIVFNNILLNSILDIKKFCRGIKSLIKNDTYEMYFEDQERLNVEIHKKFDAITVSSKADLDRFAHDNEALAEEIQILLQRALLRSRKQQLKEKPAEHVTKCISLMTEVDSRLFDKMDEQEKNGLRRELEALGGIIGNFGAQLGSNIPAPAASANKPMPAAAPTLASSENKGQFVIADTDPSKPYVLCTTVGKPITRFFVSMRFTAIALSENVTVPAQCRAYFVDDSGNTVSDVREFSLLAGNEITANIAMKPDSINLTKCRLVVQNKDCSSNEALQLIPFELKITSGFRK